MKNRKILIINDYYHEHGGTELYIKFIFRKLYESGFDPYILHSSQLSSKPDTRNKKIYYLNGLQFPRLLNNSILKLKKDVEELLREINPVLIYINNVFNPDVVKLMNDNYLTIKYFHDERTYCLGMSKLFSFLGEHPCSVKMSPLCIPCYFVSAFYRKLKYRQYTFEMKSNSNIDVVSDKSLSKLLISKLLYPFGFYKNNSRLLSEFLQCNLILTSSSYMKSCLIDNGYKPEEIKVIYIGGLNGTTESLFNEKPQKYALLLTRLTRLKGIAEILEIAGYLEHDLKIICAGSGGIEAYLRKEIKKYNLSDKFILKSWLTGNDLKKLIFESSILLITTLYPEPFGNSGPEAYSFHKPVVAYNVGGVSDWLIHNQTGYLVRRGDRIGMAKYINLLLSNDALRDKMGKKGRELYEEKFNMDLHFDQLKENIEQLIN